MIKPIIRKIKKYDEKQQKNFRISSWYGDLSHFIDFIIDYFDLNKVIKDKMHEDFDYPNEDNYLNQKSEELHYIEHLLREIKPFLSLVYEFSRDYDINKKFKAKKIKEKSIVNMVRNFIDLNRTGRKRIYNEWEKEEFNKFKEKYKNIFNYYNMINSFDGKTIGSIIDHANALKQFNIEKEQLRRYLLESKSWIKDCSKATMYRFDRDLITVKESRFFIKDALKNYDFWLKCLKNK